MHIENIFHQVVDNVCQTCKRCLNYAPKPDMALPCSKTGCRPPKHFCSSFDGGLVSICRSSISSLQVAYKSTVPENCHSKFTDGDERDLFVIDVVAEYE